MGKFRNKHGCGMLRVVSAVPVADMGDNLCKLGFLGFQHLPDFSGITYIAHWCPVVRHDDVKTGIDRQSLLFQKLRCQFACLPAGTAARGNAVDVMIAVAFDT